MVVVPKDFGSFLSCKIGGGTDPIWWINYIIFLRWGWNHQLAERCFSDDIRDVCCLNRTLVTGSQWRHRDHWILLCYLWCQGQRTVMASSRGWRGFLIYLKHEEFRTPLVLSMVFVGDKIWGYFDTLLGYPSSKNGNHRKKWVSKQSFFFFFPEDLYYIYSLYNRYMYILEKVPFLLCFCSQFHVLVLPGWPNPSTQQWWQGKSLGLWEATLLQESEDTERIKTGWMARASTTSYW